jgi:murein DD-endopeptidase MepM/ murein hydrolase activator NlpD
MDSLLAFGRVVSPLALDLTLKISMAAAAALVATRIIGRRRPALCFALIAASLVAGLVAGSVRLPVAPLTLPAARPMASTPPAPPLLVNILGSRIPVERRALVAATVPGTPLTRTAASPFDWLGWLGLAWLAGLAAVGAYRLSGAIVLRRLLRGTTPVRDPRLLAAAAAAFRECGGRWRPRLLLAAGAGTPYTAGILRPVIVLPAAAGEWSDGLLASAILHEATHVKRMDNLAAEILRGVAALAWFSPLPWLAMRSALRLREEACDEAVLGTGIAPIRYAVDLLEAACSIYSKRRSFAAATMASHDHLERRIRAILSWSRHAVRPFARLRDASAGLLLAGMAGASLLVGSVALGGIALDPRSWMAGNDPTATGPRRVVEPCTFDVTQQTEATRIVIQCRGQRADLVVPVEALPSVFPLSTRARLARPFGNFRESKLDRLLFNTGWDVWDSRSVSVVAVAPGAVIVDRVDADYGPIVEIDHGHGLRTRYGLGLYGTSLVTGGTRVVAGQTIGHFGEGKPDDIPFLHFSVLAEMGAGRLVVLDPAPLLFGRSANRKIPLAAAVLNAAVRANDRDQVSRLVGLGLDVNAAATDGTFPLEWAVVTENVALARILVAAGADPTTKIGYHGEYVRGYDLTLADLALESGNPEMQEIVAGH